MSKGQIITLILLLSFFFVTPAMAIETEPHVVKVLDTKGNEVPGAVQPSNESEHTEELDSESEDSSLTEELNPLNIGKKMVGEGFIYALELLGDAGFKVGLNNESSDTTTVKEDYGKAVALIYTMATIEFDPASNEFIREMQMKFAIIGLFVITMFIIWGAVDVNIYAATSARHKERAYILSNRYHIPINEYAITLIEMGLMLAFGFLMLKLTITMELLFTKLIMIQILDRISPTGENVIMYLMMSICYLLIGIALAYRIIIIGLFHAAYIIFVGLYCFGVTRQTAITAFWYYMKLLFLRPVIVGITAVGVGIISSIKVPVGTDVMTPVAETLVLLLIHPLMYAALVIILVIVCVFTILGVKNVLGATKYAIRKYTHTGGYYK